MTVTLAECPGSAPQRPVAAPDGPPAPISAGSAPGAATGRLAPDLATIAELLALVLDELRETNRRLAVIAEHGDQLAPVLDQLGRGPLGALLGTRRRG